MGKGTGRAALAGAAHPKRTEPQTQSLLERERGLAAVPGLRALSSALRPFEDPLRAAARARGAGAGEEAHQFALSLRSGRWAAKPLAEGSNCGS